MEWLNPETFNARVKGAAAAANAAGSVRARGGGGGGGGGGDDDEGVAWVVMFYADWSSACSHMDPMFAELSNTYSTSKLKFAKLDLGRWPETAKLFSINLDAFGSSSQVPTVILFEKRGEERGRLPRLYDDGSRMTGSRMRRVDLVKGFELDVRYAKTRTADADAEKEKEEAGKTKKGAEAKKKD